tara:strand:+ start:274 stop:1239 length:966 start_codon:yes stop_codon:yes gene_type:complete
MFNLKKLQIQRLSFFLEFISKVKIRFFVILLCFAFIGRSIYGNFEDLADLTITNEQYIWLLGGIIFSFISIIINAYAWKLLINSIGCNSNQLNIIKIFINTNIYKYFPGGIWHFISRYNNLRHKLSTEKAVESILLEPLLMLVSGLIYIPFRSFNIYIYIICWSSTLIFLPRFREFIITKLKVMKASIFNRNDKRNFRNSVHNNQNISKKIFYPYKPLFVEIIFILFRFSGFLCCINAFSIGELLSLGELISCFSLAWIIGFIVPAAPSGIGVFEAVILFTLGSKFPEAPLLASLLCYRLVSAFSDIFAASLYPFKKLLRV